MGFLAENIGRIVEMAASSSSIDTKEPDRYDALLEAMAKAGEAALPGQTAPTIGALYGCLKRGAAIVNGEMGTGKTNVAAYVAMLLHAVAEGRVDPGALADDDEVAERVRRLRRYLSGRGMRVLFVADGSKHYRKMAETLHRVARAEVHVIRSAQQLDRMTEDPPPGTLRVFVVSKDTAKMGYQTRYLKRCPSCLHDPYKAAREKERKTARKRSYNKLLFRECPQCGTSLAAPKVKTLRVGDPVFSKAARSEGSGARRIPFFKAIRRRAKWRKVFDLAIVDELHNMAALDTLQSRMLRDIRRVSGMMLGMTGTLSRGYASSLYNILWVFATERMKRRGYEGLGGLRAFVEDYGALQGFRKNQGTFVLREAPVVSPALYAHFLAPISVYMHMEDLNLQMPLYREQVHVVPDAEYVTEVQKAAKRAIDQARDIMDDLDIPRRAVTYRSAIVRFALYAPDNPTIGYDLRAKVKDAYVEENPRVREYLDDEGRLLIGEVPPMKPSSAILAKERALLDLVRKNRSEGRRCAVFVHFVNRSRIVERLTEVLRREIPGLSVGALPPSLKPERVERWLEENLHDVCIIPYGRVATGTDIVQYPTLIFYQLDLDLIKVDQAKRRAWRAVKQTKECRVHFLAYEGMQAMALESILRRSAAAKTTSGAVVGRDEAAATVMDSVEVELLNALVDSAEKSVEHDFATTEVPRGRQRPWTRWEAHYIEHVVKWAPAALAHIDPDRVPDARPDEAPPSRPATTRAPDLFDAPASEAAAEPACVPDAPKDSPGEEARPGRGLAILRRGRRSVYVEIDDADAVPEGAIGVQATLF